ncbi:hypothetical protein GCM10023086_33580 [Streptomyces venetus]|uniref:Uncharacterized protein n=1 Tax=Streptomyces venetus TaxID=1701086 RepID=A0ABP8FXT0_9ACTN
MAPCSAPDMHGHLPSREANRQLAPKNVWFGLCRPLQPYQPFDLLTVEHASTGEVRGPGVLGRAQTDR